MLVSEAKRFSVSNVELPFCTSDYPFSFIHGHLMVSLNSHVYELSVLKLSPVLFLFYHSSCSKMFVPPGWLLSNGPEGAHTKKVFPLTAFVTFAHSHRSQCLYILLFSPYTMAYSWV